MYRIHRENQELKGKTMDCNKITAWNSLFVYVPGQYLRKKKNLIPLLNTVIPISSCLNK